MKSDQGSILERWWKESNY